MKRIGCTNTLACRVLCAAAGLALAGSLATAQTSTGPDRRGQVEPAGDRCLPRAVAE